MLFLRLAFIFILFNLCGCLGKTQSGTEFIVDLHAAANINKNNFGDAAPIQIFIYKVKSIDNFSALSPYELMDPDAPTTNDTYNKLADIIIQPSQTTSLTLPLESGKNHIGIVAAYRDLAASRWLATTTLIEKPRYFWLTPFADTTPHINVTVEKSQIIISGRKES